jgi:hypothetical protein
MHLQSKFKPKSQGLLLSLPDDYFYKNRTDKPNIQQKQVLDFHIELMTLLKHRICNNHKSGLYKNKKQTS